MNEARFAEAGFATDQHHAAGTVLDLRPQSVEERDLLVAASQRGEGNRRKGVACGMALGDLCV